MYKKIVSLFLALNIAFVTSVASFSFAPAVVVLVPVVETLVAVVTVGAGLVGAKTTLDNAYACRAELNSYADDLNAFVSNGKLTLATGNAKFRAIYNKFWDIIVGTGDGVRYSQVDSAMTGSGDLRVLPNLRTYFNSQNIRLINVYEIAQGIKSPTGDAPAISVSSFGRWWDSTNYEIFQKWVITNTRTGQFIVRYTCYSYFYNQFTTWQAPGTTIASVNPTSIYSDIKDLMAASSITVPSAGVIPVVNGNQTISACLVQERVVPQSGTSVDVTEEAISIPGDPAVPVSYKNVKVPGVFLPDASVPLDGSGAGTNTGTNTGANTGVNTGVNTSVGTADLTVDVDKTAQLDFSPLYQDFTKKFPFSIPWDVYKLFSVFDAPPRIFNETFVLDLGKWGKVSFPFDASGFDGIVSLLRQVEFIVFCYFLMRSTKPLVWGD